MLRASVVCPFSIRLYNTLTDEVLPEYEEELALIFHQLPQPWHFQSCILHEAVCAAKLVNDAAEQGVWDVLMDEDTFSEFADNAVGDASKAQLQSQLADLFEDEGVPRDALLSTLQAGSADEPNCGSAATQSLKYAVKHHRQLGIHVTPTCRVNGITTDTSSSWSKAEWAAFLDPLLK